MDFSPEADKKLDDMLKDMLTKQYLKGMEAGAYAASKAVYDKLNDKSKPLTERIDNVNKYCNVAVKNKDKFLDITENEG